ncbi:phage tail protein [uncultured Cedecea sp.]|uniref:phage tail protein n=1 Tax=uncultured Cedecea sp. TaxID=988762 RepID=UPI0026313FE7|nr:phage tail protein [uncultured Cedecea sp.]
MDKSFNKSSYPKLALVYPSGKLPDLRGLFIRGSDQGRGYDAGRQVLTEQGDAIRNITGQVKTSSGRFDNEKINGAFRITQTGLMGTGFDGWYEHGIATFDASKMVPTADENRPKNMSFIYIIKGE